MKARKSMMLLLLGFSFIFALTSCKKSKKEDEPVLPDPIEEPTEVVKPQLSSISCDTTKVKKEFYLGEEFTSEGLVVYANLVKFENGQTNSIKEECKNYSLDTEAFNMNVCGTYPIKVLYRLGTKVVSNSYDVVVKSTVLSESGQTYVGGLEIKYDSNFKKELLLDETLTFSRSKVTCKLHNFKNGAEESQKNVAYTKVTPDLSSLQEFAVAGQENTFKITKTGTYMIKYTYEETLVINGKSVNNVVTSYTLVNVTNPVTNFEKISTGDTTYAASTKGLDFSNWKFKITRQVERENQEILFDENYVSVSGGLSFIEGTTNIVVRLLEDISKYVEVPITVVASTTQDIISNTDLSVQTPRVEGDDKYLDFGTSGIFQAKNATGNDGGRDTKDRYQSLSFPQRIKIKGDDSQFIIRMEKAGDIVIFAANANGGAPIYVAMSDSENEITSVPTTAGKQEIVELKFTVDKAGTYYFTAPDSVYIHGCVVATNK